MKRALLLAALAVVLPAIVYARTTGDQFGDTAVPDIVPHDDGVGPVGVVDELRKAHSHVTDIMTDASLTRFNVDDVEEEVYLSGTWVDEESQTLVVVLDMLHALDPVDAEDLREELGLGIIPLDIRYGSFEPHSSSRSQPCPSGATPLTCYYWNRYVSECTSTPNIHKCRQFAGVITRAGLALPAASGSISVDTDGDGINDAEDQCDTRPETFNGYRDADGCPDTVPRPSPKPVTRTPTSVPVPAGGIIFQDGFTSGLGKWVESGQREWQAGYLDENKVIPGYTLRNKVAEADDCDDEACVLTLRSPIDLSGYKSATLEFDRFVDLSLDRGEYLAVSIGNNGAYREIFRWTDGAGDTDRWHHEIVDLDRYLRSGFSIKFSTEESSSIEDVAIDNVKIRGVPKASCSLVVSASAEAGGPVKASWNACENVRRYHVYASENGGPRSYLGHTTGTSFTHSGADEGKRYVISVRAQITGSSYTGYFSSNTVTVPVLDRTAPEITVPEDIIANITETSVDLEYEVTAYDKRDGSVAVSCSPASGSTFQVGETTVRCTARDAAGNRASADFTVTVNQVDCGDGQFHSDLRCYLKETFGRLIGGDGIYIRGNVVEDGRITSGYGYSRATIGLVVDTHNHGVGALSASHWSTEPKLANHVPFIGSRDSPVIVGNFEIDTKIFENRDSKTADSVFVKVTNDDVTPHIKKIRYGLLDYTVTEFGGYNDLAHRSDVKIAGLRSEGVGTLLHYNATVSLDGVILTKQGLADYVADYGDSGSPIFVDRGFLEVGFLGTHVGLGCVIKATPQPPVNIGCVNNDGYIATFTPWENIVSELGIRVK